MASRDPELCFFLACPGVLQSGKEHHSCDHTQRYDQGLEMAAVGLYSGKEQNVLARTQPYSQSSQQVALEVGVPLVVLERQVRSTGLGSKRYLMQNSTYLAVLRGLPVRGVQCLLACWTGPRALSCSSQRIN